MKRPACRRVIAQPIQAATALIEDDADERPPERIRSLVETAGEDADAGDAGGADRQERRVTAAQPQEEEQQRAEKDRGEHHHGEEGGDRHPDRETGGENREQRRMKPLPPSVPAQPEDAAGENRQRERRTAGP